MAASISDKFGVEPQLIKGKNGIFDVVADGKLIFSKRKVGRFPRDDEVLELLRK